MFWIAGSQLGYDRLGVKRAVACGPPWMGYPARRAVKFSLVDETGKAVLEKHLQPFEKSFDSSNLYWIADFSEVHENGKYRLRVGRITSYPFSIEDDVYSGVVRRGYRYFSYQRCGCRVEGVHEPCHLDDGWRTDTKEHWDAVGGWHDAGDIRKGMSLHTLAAYALLHLHESLMSINDSEEASEVLEEALWGNKYFLKMQDPETGNVFICVYRDRDGNTHKWNILTDNVVGTADDRPILVPEPSDVQEKWSGVPTILRNAFGFVALEGAMARIMAEKDPEYSKRCLEAAAKAWRWAHEPENYGDHVTIHAWNLLAGLEMFKATGGQGYLQEAVEKANRMVELQEKADYGDYNGFFWAEASKEKVYWHITSAADPLIALAKLCLELPDNPDWRRWRDAVRLHTSFLKKVSELSPFSIIPCVFSDKPLSEDRYRKAGKLYYRFFYPRRIDVPRRWWVGTNSVVLSNAVGLLYAHQVTGDEGLKTLAKAQLEWVFGNNPFRVCMMVGEGTNTTTVYSAKYLFKDWDGIIPGGIVNGIGGTENDEPCYYPTEFYPTQGEPDWETKEYWTPHNAYFAWAISQLMKLSKLN